jgi:hypothetical protein
MAKATAGKAPTEYTPKKTTCEITAEEFDKNAKPILLRGTMDDQEFTLALGRKHFSTGSFGWSLSGEKKELIVDGKLLKVQVVVNMIVVGSKEVNGK